jgi:GNAT superfamily N-acetyltransferase
MNHNLSIRNFAGSDWDKVGGLYERIQQQHADVIYWWPGPDESYWDDVFCVFNGDSLVAKGQVDVINIIPPNSSKECTHAIYVNLKVDPEWDTVHEIKDMLYDKLYARALILKEGLPQEYATKLCVGNFASEVVNNEYFLGKHYAHFYSVYHMRQELTTPIKTCDLPPQFACVPTPLSSRQDMEDYLKIDAEIWPESRLGYERLDGYKTNPLWTVFQIREEGTLAASLMAWKDADEEIGVLEDLFVRKPWRGQGLAKYLLTQGLHYLQKNDVHVVQLVVYTDNSRALSLYHSVGFSIHKEERRYSIDL